MSLKLVTLFLILFCLVNIMKSQESGENGRFLCHRHDHGSRGRHYHNSYNESNEQFGGFEGHHHHHHGGPEGMEGQEGMEGREEFEQSENGEYRHHHHHHGHCLFKIVGILFAAAAFGLCCCGIKKCRKMRRSDCRRIAKEEIAKNKQQQPTCDRCHSNNRNMRYDELNSTGSANSIGSPAFVIGVPQQSAALNNNRIHMQHSNNLYPDLGARNEVLQHPQQNLNYPPHYNYPVAPNQRMQQFEIERK